MSEHPRAHGDIFNFCLTNNLNPQIFNLIEKSSKKNHI